MSDSVQTTMRIYFCSVYDRNCAEPYYGTVFAKTPALCIDKAVDLIRRMDEKITDEQSVLALRALVSGNDNFIVQEDTVSLGLGHIDIKPTTEINFDANSP